MKILVCIIVCLAALLCNAQKNYHNGYVVLQTGDTLQGQIDQREWSLSPTSVLFRDATAAEGRRYAMDEIIFFEILNREKYQRAVVKISMDPIIVNDIGVKDTSFRIDTVFLRTIETGTVLTLYSYRDRLKERFYVKEAGTEIYTELGFRRYQEYDYVSILKTEDIFKKQLSDILIRRGLLTPQLQQRIQTTPYQQNALRRTIYHINNAVSGQTESRKQRGKISFVAGAGIQQITQNYRGAIFYTENPKNEAALFPHFSGGIDLFNNRYTEKFIIRTELGISPTKHISHGINGMNFSSRNAVNAKHETSGKILSLSARLMYNVYNTKNIKVPLSIGAGANLAGYGKNTYTETDAGDGTILKSKEDYFDLERIYYSTNISAGMVIMNKWEASVWYQPRSSITNYNFFSIGHSILRFQVNYLLRR